MSKSWSVAALYMVLVVAVGGASGVFAEEKQKWTGHVRQALPAEAPVTKVAAPTSTSPELKTYMQNLNRKIKRNWFPPTCLSKVTIIRFTIRKDGYLSSSKVVQSCGVNIGDEAAMRAITKAAPYKPLPDTEQNATEFEFDFDFKPNGTARLANIGK